MTQYGKSTYSPTIGNFTSLPWNLAVSLKYKYHIIVDLLFEKFMMKIVKKKPRFSMQTITIFAKGSSCHTQITDDEVPSTTLTQYCWQKFCHSRLKTSPSFDDDDVPIEPSCSPAKHWQSYSNCKILQAPLSTRKARSSRACVLRTLQQHDLEVIFGNI